MASWSPENATKAYLTTLKMERKENEPESAEFISALAAGNNAQVMVIAFAEKIVINNILALIAAANQTGGSVICIVPNQEEVQSAKYGLKSDAKFVKFIIGNAREVLLNKYYKEADFLLIDCNIQDYEQIIRQVQVTREVKKGGLVVGFNAFCKGSSWQWSGLGSHLLPIGDGLLVTRIDGNMCKGSSGKGGVRKSNWIVKVDQCTGEEHVFRVSRSKQRKLEVVV